MDLSAIRHLSKSSWIFAYVFVVALAIVLVVQLAFMITEALAPFLIVDGIGLWSIIPR